MQRGNISMVAWQWGGGSTSQGQVLEHKFHRGARAYCFRSEIFHFLFYGFGIWPLKFSQNHHCFGQQQPPRHLGTYLRIYFYRVQFWVSLKTSGPSTPIKHITEYTLWTTSVGWGYSRQPGRAFISVCLDTDNDVKLSIF